MKTIIPAFGLAAGLALSASGQVYINELMVNAPGSDTTYEMFELRGAPNMSLDGYYLISLEGEGPTGNPGVGDVNQFLNLSSYSLGANGFLVGRQYNSPYGPVNPNATLLQSTTGPGWVNSGVYFSDGTAPSDMENSATTILLVRIGSGAAPTTTLDMDSNNDGLLDIPTGWTIVDSVGLMDSVGAAADNMTYGAINFRVGTLGGSAYGNVVQVPGTGSSLYVGRRGDTTGSTADDWFGSTMTGTGPNFTFTANTTDAFYTGKGLPDMLFGDTNPVPEPGVAALLGIGVLLSMFRRR